LPELVLEACDTAAAVWMRLIRTPQLKLKTDSLFGTRHSFARRRGCVVVVDGLQDSTTAWPDDLRDGLPGARWRSHSGYDADGAGSTSFAVWRPGVLCLTHWEVPAGIDDDGRHITGDSEHVEVTCVPALPGDTPDRTPASGARRVGDEMQRTSGLANLRSTKSWGTLHAKRSTPTRRNRSKIGVSTRAAAALWAPSMPSSPESSNSANVPRHGHGNAE
jgi:hypothetical protein